MSKFDSKKVMPRYAFIAVIMTLVAISVLGKTLYIMTEKRAYWEEVADRVKVDSLKTQPMRGNILRSEEGHALLREDRFYLHRAQRYLPRPHCG